MQAAQSENIIDLPYELLKERLVAEILRARKRVYHVGDATPLEIMPLSDDFTLYVKREDLSPINAYKWRGAYNCISLIGDKTGKTPLIAASAGNHAQGVALAARKLEMKARIFMPLSAPRTKQDAVKRLGGEYVEIVLEGDDYNDAGDAAKQYMKTHGGIYIHPFDHLYTIAGQATIADEMVLSGEGPFDYMFLQIGGGGMAAGIATWMKMHYPDIKVIGVEEQGQACMKAAFEAGHPVTLDSVDAFCDGTAVIRAGDLSYKLGREVFDEIITVSNEEACAAIQTFWEVHRVIPETSAALGLAGLIRYKDEHKNILSGKKAIVVISGSNVDFGKLSLIGSNSSVGAQRRRYYRLHISETSGSLLSMIEDIFSHVNISEFQYGKISEEDAWPVVAFTADPDKLAALHKTLEDRKFEFADVTSEPDVRYRVINYNPALFKDPEILRIHFPERKGALRDFLRDIAPVTNICYFNYAYTGESIGRALMAFEFENDEDKVRFRDIIDNSVVTSLAVEAATASRILAQ